MRKIIILLPLLILIISCAKQGLLRDEKFYLEFDNGWRTKQYDIPVEKCFDSFSSYLIDSEIGIEKVDNAKGKIVTSRWRYHSEVKSEAKLDESGTKATATGTKFDEYAKYYVEVSGDDKLCNLKIVRVRLWLNDDEQERVYGFTLTAHMRDLQKGFDKHLAYDDF